MGETPFEVSNFVSDVAGNCGFFITPFRSTDPTTLMLVQPIDAQKMEGPDENLVDDFIEKLTSEQRKYRLPMPLHFEKCISEVPEDCLPFDNDLPSEAYMVRISTLE